MKRMFVFTIFVILTQNAFALDCKRINDSCPPGCGWNEALRYCAACPLVNTVRADMMA